MQYFTMQGNSLKDAIDRMKEQYGENARILTHRGIKRGGFLGFFAQEGIEITGYLAESRPSTKLNLETEKMKILQNVKKDTTMSMILKEIQSLKEQISTQKPLDGRGTHPAMDEYTELLKRNDFSETLIALLVQRLESEFSLQELDNKEMVHKALIDWIADGIKIHKPFSQSTRKPHICTIVGPTGVGKTTTIAKLAAIHGINPQRGACKKVRMITIDNYRIAAKKQIETYAEIMQIPVSFVETFEDLKKTLALYNDTDLILIDTIGKSPNDYDKLAEMKKVLEAVGSDNDTHLAMSASVKASDMEEILRQFEPFKYQSIIITKLDETSSIGNVISSLILKQKPVSYFTDGQVVPQDIEEATILKLILKLEGFHLDREYLDKKYGKKLSPINSLWS
ncbi:MAG: flagellar biosynthesis protein FlhF [Spirochaetales bacterium]|nr:flagellar biosynthesis protein FlhF [Spirochaetales bacterium]